MKTVVCIYLVFLTVFLYSWDLNKLDSQLFAYININDLDGVKSVVEQGANVNAIHDVCDGLPLDRIEIG